MLDTMPVKDYKKFDPADALAPGYYSLVLAIYFKSSRQYVKIAVGSVSTALKVPCLPAALTIDLEPVTAH